MILSTPAWATLAGLAVAPAAWGQETPASAQPNDAAGDLAVLQEAADQAPDRIVVSGVSRGRTIGEVPPDVTFDAADIGALGVTDLAGLLEAIAPETASGGGGDPVVLLNGVRIASFREIRDYPSEAVERVEVLPEEAALSYGYAADRRVVNIVLRERFEAFTLLGEVELRTEGAGEEYETRDSYVRVRGDKRWNLSGRFQETRPILESDRDVVAERNLYSLAGNVAASEGFAEIDPQLSALAGTAVQTASVPASAGPPALADFLPGANAPSTTSQAAYKTLVSQRTDAELSGAYNQTLGVASQVGVSAALDYFETESLLGLRRLEVELPAGSAYSPFSQSVRVSRLIDALGPRRRNTDQLSAELGMNVSHVTDDWIWTGAGKIQQRTRNTSTERTLSNQTLQTAVTAGANPFGDVTSYLSIGNDLSRSESTDVDLTINVNGDLFEAPAGDVTASFTAGYDHSNRASYSRRGGVEESVTLARDLFRVRSSLDIPVVARWMDVPLVERLNFNVNLQIEELSDFGDLTAYGGGVNWTPVNKVRLYASYSAHEGAPSASQLGDPTTENPEQRIFDYLNGETVLATRIDGGNPDLSANSREIVKIGARLEPFDDVDLTLRADYTDNEVSNPVRSFPDPTPEIEAAFPGRFLRDQDGRLVAFDNRPINLERSDNRELRIALRYTGDLGGGDGPATKFYASLNQLLRLEDRLIIEGGLAPVDYLNGAAAGSQGGRPESEINLSTGLSRGGRGARLDLDWRGATRVDTGAAQSQTLEFSDLATLRAQAFYSFDEASGVPEQLSWLTGSRVSLTVHNLFDEKLQVSDAQGVTPVRYQQDLLDPVGRTIEVQFRKQFK